MELVWKFIGLILSAIIEVIGTAIIIPFVALFFFLICFILKKLKIIKGNVNSLFENHKTTGPAIAIASIFLFWIIFGLIIEAIRK